MDENKQNSEVPTPISSQLSEEEKQKKEQEAREWLAKYMQRIRENMNR